MLTESKDYKYATTNPITPLKESVFDQHLNDKQECIQNCVPPQMFHMHVYFILHSLKSFRALILLSYIHLKDNQGRSEEKVRED